MLHKDLCARTRARILNTKNNLIIGSITRHASSLYARAMARPALTAAAAVLAAAAAPALLQVLGRARLPVLAGYEPFAAPEGWPNDQRGGIAAMLRPPSAPRENFLLAFRILSLFATSSRSPFRGGSPIICLAGAQVPSSGWHDDRDATSSAPPAGPTPTRRYFFFFYTFRTPVRRHQETQRPGLFRSRDPSIQLPASLARYLGAFDASFKLHLLPGLGLYLLLFDLTYLLSYFLLILLSPHRPLGQAKRSGPTARLPLGALRATLRGRSGYTTILGGIPRYVWSYRLGLVGSTVEEQLWFWGGLLRSQGGVFLAVKGGGYSLYSGLP